MPESESVSPVDTSSKGHQKNKAKKHRNHRKSAGRKLNVDIVTGRDLLSVYFDPNQAIGFTIPNDEWLGRHYLLPGSVIKQCEAEGELTVKLASGDVFKIPMEGAVHVTAQDDEGIDDILGLHDFSEKSLLHTLRVRYQRSDIYTYAGPILVSINPYKLFPDLYSDKTMFSYHGAKQRECAPHVFSVAERAYSALMFSMSATKVSNQSIIISGESGAGKVLYFTLDTPSLATNVIYNYL